MTVTAFFENHHILKFADDAVMQNHEHNSHGAVVDYVVNWCHDSFLVLNIPKTKDAH